jgi:murein DD-endopeptidase MepM/ murein hydrolase activator NlpD
MNSRRLLFIFLAGAVLFIVTVSCALTGNQSGGASTSPPEATTALQGPTPESQSQAAPDSDSETAPPQAEPSEPQPAPSESASNPAPQEQTCAEDTCVLPGHFVLSRPIGPDGRNTVVYADRFGSYRRATKDARHGATFLNSTGTPVLAAADGTVVIAGDDSKTAYGLNRNMYGNLVILQHDLPGVSDPVYTLYAHLSEISVKPKDQVQRGDQIGLVGMTGNVAGSSLLFEVRLGENSYAAARNPELWLEPLSDEDSGEVQGALAGRVLNSEGKYVSIPNILIERLAGPGQPAMDQIYLKTYAGQTGLSPWAENFASGDMPAGEYQISFLMNGMHQREVTVEPGKLTLVTFELE